MSTSCLPPSSIGLAQQNTIHYTYNIKKSHQINQFITYLMAGKLGYSTFTAINQHKITIYKPHDQDVGRPHSPYCVGEWVEWVEDKVVGQENCADVGKGVKSLRQKIPSSTLLSGKAQLLGPFKDEFSLLFHCPTHHGPYERYQSEYPPCRMSGSCVIHPDVSHCNKKPMLKRHVHTTN